jgi:hypothetical protein
VPQGSPVSRRGRRPARRRVVAEGPGAARGLAGDRFVLHGGGDEHGREDRECRDLVQGFAPDPTIAGPLGHPAPDIRAHFSRNHVAPARTMDGSARVLAERPGRGIVVNCRTQEGSQRLVPHVVDADLVAGCHVGRMTPRPRHQRPDDRREETRDRQRGHGNQWFSVAQLLHLGCGRATDRRHHHDPIPHNRLLEGGADDGTYSMPPGGGRTGIGWLH